MRKIINYIIVLCSLCFVMEAKAQQANIKLMSLEQKLNSLNEQQKEVFEEMRRGTPSMLSFYDEDEVVRNIEDSPKIQVVELHEASLLAKLKNTSYGTDFESAKLLIVRIKDGDELHAADLALFGSLKYILLKSFDRIDDAKASKVVHTLLEDQEKLSAVEIFYTFIGSEG